MDEDLLSLFGDVDNYSEGDDESLFDELAHIVQDLGLSILLCSFDDAI